MQHEPVTVTLDDNSEGRMARVRGVLDVFSSPTLAARTLAGLPNETRELFIDLREVSFVDSAGVSALVRLSQQAKTRALHVHARLNGAQTTINATMVDVLRRVLPFDD